MTALNQAKLQAFLARVLHDLAAIQSAPLVVIGDRLGLYRAMADGGPLTAVELAERAAVDERYAREWLVNQAAGGYVHFDPATARFSLPPEHAAVLVEDDPRAFAPAAFQLATGLERMTGRVAAAFRAGAGVPMAEYDPDVLEGIDRMSRIRCRTYLLSNWIPALDGVQAKLEGGAQVADLGCGAGAALLTLAPAFPRSRFVGFDTHAPSIERARRAAADAGLSDSVRFEVASADDFPGDRYDLVTCFDCVHELADPVAAARRARAVLPPDGAWLIVEPAASERVEENLSALGRLASSISALHCLPVSRANGGPGLGAMLGQRRVENIATAGGFTRFRKVAETAFNFVFEARP